MTNILLAIKKYYTYQCIFHSRISSYTGHERAVPLGGICAAGSTFPQYNPSRYRSIVCPPVTGMAWPVSYSCSTQ